MQKIVRPILLLIVIFGVVFVSGCKPPGTLTPLAITAVNDIPNSVYGLQVLDAEILIGNTMSYEAYTTDVEIDLIVNNSVQEILPLTTITNQVNGQNQIQILPRFVIPTEVVGDGRLNITVWVNTSQQLVISNEVSILATPQESEPNNSRFTDADQITLQQGYEGEISSLIDEDWYVFSLPANSSCGILVDGSVSDLSIQVYLDNDGTPVQSMTSDDFQDRLEIDNNDSISKTIYIKVSPDAVQNYFLLVESEK